MSYETGYGKPPKNHQFKKGISGNQNGRPRKMIRNRGQSIDMMKAVTKALRRKIEVSERGSIKKISVLDATINKQIKTALVDGDQKALGKVLSLAEKVYRANLEGRSEEPLHIIVTGGLPDEPGEIGGSIVSRRIDAS